VVGALGVTGNGGFTIPDIWSAGMDDFTFAGWIWSDNNDSWDRIFLFSGTDGGYFDLRRNEQSRLWVEIRDQSSTPTRKAYPSVNGHFPNNRWVHAAVTIKSGVVTFYQDGESLGTVMYEGNQPWDIDPRDIGTGTGSVGTDGLEGKFDDFRFYDYALSSGEVRRLYTLTGPTPSGTSTPTATPTGTPIPTPIVETFGDNYPPNYDQFDLSNWQMENGGGSFTGSGQYRITAPDLFAEMKGIYREVDGGDFEANLDVLNLSLPDGAQFKWQFQLPSPGGWFIANFQRPAGNPVTLSVDINVQPGDVWTHYTTGLVETVNSVKCRIRRIESTQEWRLWYGINGSDATTEAEGSPYTPSHPSGQQTMRISSVDWAASADLDYFELSRSIGSDETPTETPVPTGTPIPTPTSSMGLSYWRLY
jgi:hypothetical protein